MDPCLADFVENPTHSTKKELREKGSFRSYRPPRLLVKKPISRKLFSSQPICLMRNNDYTKLSKIYDDSLSLSYFDQCFEVFEKLGEGSYGEVYKAAFKENNQFYAVKVCKDDYKMCCDRSQRINEIRKYESIPKHENIVELYNAWEQDDVLYLQMELGENSLNNYTEINRELTEGQLWNVLLDMLLALKTLHDANMVHLDVKLENMIIFADGTCKLGDFGLVVNLKQDNLKKAVEGDSKYLPSELMRGQFSKAADVFSLGISMLELSCDLELPPHGILWHNLRNGQFPDNITYGTSKEFLNIIRRMMTRDHRRRPSIKCLLRHPRLRRMLKQRRDASSSGIPVPERLTPPFRVAQSAPSTPPLKPLDTSQLSMLQVTPPLGYSTPDLKGIFTEFNRSLQTSSSNKSENMDHSGNDSAYVSGIMTPIPCSFTKTPFLSNSLHRIESKSELTSAKKLDFWNYKDLY